MAKQKSNRPTWSKVKPAVANLDQSQLVKLVADLYRLSKDNQDFLHARFDVGDDSLAPYKKTIGECMFVDIYSKRTLQVAKAKKAINDYSKAIADPAGEAELMIYFVERGNRYAVEFGDGNSAFYNALNGMYRQAIQKVLSLPEEQQESFRAKLEEINTFSSRTGWDYQATMITDYNTAFPEEE